MTDALLDYMDFNVIVVDWNAGARAIYSQAAANTRLVGLEVASLIEYLITQRDCKAKGFHLIGHSLGSHISGYAGEALIKKYSQKLGRISGLDPAEPLFQSMPEFVRLDPSDAEFVDAIHTDSKSIIMLGYGMMDPVGHVDFYPNGGVDQPGCALMDFHENFENLDDVGRHLVACSHDRALQYYIESIRETNSTCKFIAHECSSYEKFKQKLHTMKPSLVSVHIILLVLGNKSPEAKPYKQSNFQSFNQSQRNVTFLLNNLLKQYDNSLRPGIGGPPLLVEINIQVRSMGPISEVDMSYSMDCYFRQSWVDTRLAFSGQKNLALSIEMLNKIWKPDTYIYNGRKSYLHTITTPNKFVRLFPEGKVLYSQRLTIKASCNMDLADFPMDQQSCPLQIGSFGYSVMDLAYVWTTAGGVSIASDMKLSQFDLIQAPTGNSTVIVNNGAHSTLLVNFHLQRHMGNFMIQVYGPCILLVVISWVSFWLNREATSDRINLGVTTVLTMTFLGLEARTDLPQVAYATALDYFVFISFIFIFSTVVQFGLVHYFTKVGAGEYYLEELEETTCLVENIIKSYNKNLNQQWIKDEIPESSTSEEETPCDYPPLKRVSSLNTAIIMGDAYSTGLSHRCLSLSSSYNIQSISGNLRRKEDILNHHPRAIESMESSKRTQRKVYRRKNSTRVKEKERKDTIYSLPQCQCKRCIARDMNNQDKALNSVSTIDRISRAVFPLAFFIINIFYWYNYLKHSQRIDLSFEYE
ncbi:gamma-aminobutyric acid receptor subunit alpha-6 isoform X2 [Lepeophtheirus salmonis]